MNNWRKYNGALIPSTPPDIEVDIKDINKRLIQENAYFARWTSDFDSEQESEFWYVICDTPMQIKDYSRNTRSKITRANKKLYVKEVTKDFLANNSYSVYLKAFRRYEASSSPNKKKYFINSLQDLEGDWQFWGIFLKKNDQLVGYSQNKIIGDYCDYSTIKFDPDYLKYYSSYILYYVMNHYYLNKNSFKYINIGARSLLHKTMTQNYLIEKFGFRKAYCTLHLEYRYLLRLIVQFLYKFKPFFRFFRWNFIINKIYGLLLHEEIKRTFYFKLKDKLQPIIIIGAARSGTHVIATTIKKNIDCIYLNEINDLWKKRFPFLNLDEIEESKITPNKVNLIREDFKKLLRGRKSSPFLLEKTASNCLRLELINKVFPDAKFIHILRDGRDVAVSTRRKYQGDIRKISSHKSLQIHEKRRFPNFFKEIKHKVQNGLTPFMLLTNSLRYFRMSLVLLGLRKRDFWGPRFKGFRKLYNELTLIEVALEQWRYSVNSIFKFISRHPNKVILTLKYEDLILNPNHVVKKVIQFILNDDFTEEKLQHDIKTNGFKTWREVLNDEDKLLISTRISDLLKELDYE
ncbi:MAG: sulfotransferase family protein [Flavobacteriales bacterium]